MKKSKKVLVIVAHPDDETIWAGGTLLKNKSNWDITIISLCRKDDPDRAPKFKRVCKEYGAKSFISDLDDEEGGELKEITLNEITTRVNQLLPEKKYDYIFTHGENGEYGHVRHKDVHDAVFKILKEKKLSCKELWLFSYREEKDFCRNDEKADKFINLKDDYYFRKKDLITNLYGFSKESFESICCRNIESFKIQKMQ